MNKYYIGQEVGGNNITYLAPAEPKISKKGRKDYMALFKCHCGKEFTARISNVTRGRTLSCHGRGWKGDSHLIHGLSKDKDYIRWLGIKARCFRVSSKKYKYYGGRGITVYEPWVNDPVSFISYIRNLPDYGKKGLTLNRTNNDGNYEPGNLRWATAKVQAGNRRIIKRKLVTV